MDALNGKDKIRSIVKKFWILIAVLCAFMIGVLLLMLKFLNEFEGMSEGEVKLVKIVALSITFANLIAVVFGFYLTKIRRLKQLENVVPQYGTVAGFLEWCSGTDNGKRQYSIAPIVKTANGKLMATGARGNVSWYSTVYMQKGSSFSDKRIIKSDRSTLAVGDRVYVYYLCPYKDAWHTDSGNGIVYMKKRPAYVTEKSFEDYELAYLELFEGAVDVDF